MELAAIEKGGYMTISWSKRSLNNPAPFTIATRGRLDAKAGAIRMRGIEQNIDQLKNANRIMIVACGTSWHAGLRRNTSLKNFAAYRLRLNTHLNSVTGIPSSTKATSSSPFLKAGKRPTRLWRWKGPRNRAPLSSASSMWWDHPLPVFHAGAYTHAGPEIGVASTKAFTGSSQFCAWWHWRSRRPKVPFQTKDSTNYSWNSKKCRKSGILRNAEEKKIADAYKDAGDFLFLGRGYNFPVALEGALKLKEISYIHAEGYPAAEMKHGPIALVDENLPVVFIATKDPYHEKIVSNMQGNQG